MNSKLDTKETIRLAAKCLFAQKGFNATTTRDIVRESGVNISAIAYHFGGKEGLLLSLFDDFLHEDQEPRRFGDTATELTSLISRIIGLRFQDPDLVTILQQEIVINSSRTDTIKERMIPIWQRIKTLLEQGKQEGCFQFRNPYNALTFVMSVTVFPRHNPFFQDLVDESESQEEVTEEILHFILRGLGFVKDTPEDADISGV